MHRIIPVLFCLTLIWPAQSLDSREELFLEMRVGIAACLGLMASLISEIKEHVPNGDNWNPTMIETEDGYGWDIVLPEDNMRFLATCSLMGEQMRIYTSVSRSEMDSIIVDTIIKNKNR